MLAAAEGLRRGVQFSEREWIFLVFDSCFAVDCVCDRSRVDLCIGRPDRVFLFVFHDKQNLTCICLSDSKVSAVTLCCY